MGPDQLAKGSVGTDQIAKGAVGGDQLAPGAVGSGQLAKGAVDSAALGAGAVTPAQMQFPVALVASPSGGALIAATTPEMIPYPLTDASWMPHGDGVDLVVGNASVTLAPSVGALGCLVWFEFAGNGEFGPEFHPSVEFDNRSTTEAATRTRSIEPFTVPVDPSGQTELTARMRNLGSCAGPSTIESMDLRVIELG